ncbi:MULTISPECIES: nuclear transport factor 2 family protein [Pandoraea]|uniref:Ketosteroid isomerase n=1 Tax=Pandoraea communis TaxID=2508297 RepID=A0A5E4XUE5_9BURK|nr:MULTISPECIES: nuclear transport factor 2 family protein [Pandoraea]ALS66631.1 ketosteroid isomerase [Pandoraea apista]CFB61387.1 hypothetical protein LMG16407_01446 [Pandoraea apista]VVE40071.1 ketosteroid isomerase [Pandoraea communis]
MNDQNLIEEVRALRNTVNELAAEADIRRIVARYMFLCDIPLPATGVALEDRVKEIVSLYSEDAIWEGVGAHYNAQFGRFVGREQIYAHLSKFFEPRDPKMILNCHYLTSEQIHVRGETAEGQWVHFQPWIFEDGSSVLRSSRINNAFKKVDGVWKMSRYRTENVYIAPLPNNWATNVASTSILMETA